MFRSQYCLIILLCLMSACAAPKKSASDADDSSMRVAQKLEQSGELNASGDIYRELIAHHEDGLKPYLKLAAIYRKQGRPDDAESVLRQAQAMEPDNTQVLRSLSYALSDSGKVEQAVMACDQWIAFDPEDADAYNAKALAFDHSGNHLAAQELYQHALRLSPAAAAIRNNYALSLVLSGQADQAIAILEPLSVQPEATMVMRQNLALAYGMKGDDDKALAMGLKDLKPEQAQENLRYYQEARAHALKPAGETAAPMQPNIPDAQPHANVTETSVKPQTEQPVAAIPDNNEHPPQSLNVVNVNNDTYPSTIRNALMH